MAGQRLLSRGWRLRLIAPSMVGVVAAGCSSSGAGKPEFPPPLTTQPSTPQPSPTPTPDPLEVEVLATVDGWLEAHGAALTGPGPTAEGLSDYATDDGVVLNEANSRGQAVVEACLDGAGFQRIELDSAEPLPIGDDSQPHRHWVWVHAWHIPDVGWRVEHIPYIPGWMSPESDGHVLDERHQC